MRKLKIICKAMKTSEHAIILKRLLTYAKVAQLFVRINGYRKKV